MHANDKEPNAARSHPAEITIHEFQVVKTRDTTDGPPNPQEFEGGRISNASLLQAGSTLVREAVVAQGWENTRQIDYKLEVNPKACFAWAQRPPRVSNSDKSHSRLTTWGEPVRVEEIIFLDVLDEFQHQGSSEGKRRPGSDALHRNDPMKKRKLFSGSLHGVIPQPHYYSSTFNTTTGGCTAKVSTYTKSRPVPIPPYGDGVVEPFRPLSSYARTAWIIPIRGILPWATCTPAVVIEDDDGVGKEGSWIQWTKAAVISFWTFLLSVREAGKLGQVGVSFHIMTPRGRETPTSAGVINEQYNSSGHERSEPEVWSQPLSFADYVKVYHEANNAMVLRRVLDAWAYVCPSGRKVRVLTGSKLVLLDERSKGIFVS